MLVDHGFLAFHILIAVLSASATTSILAILTP